MNGPRELFTVLLQHVTTLAAALLFATAWVPWHVVYPLGVTVESVMQRVAGVVEQAAVLNAQVMRQIGLLIEQGVQHVVHLFLPVLDEAAMMTFSTMDAMTVVAIYSMYVWTDVVIQTVHSAMALPSIELSIKGDVPGGIAVWLVVAVALVTYAFVYRQYPSHQEWVGTVLSFVLPLLTRSLWKSD